SLAIIFTGRGAPPLLVCPPEGCFFVWGAYRSSNTTYKYGGGVPLPAPPLQMESESNDALGSANGLALTLSQPGHLDGRVAGAITTFDGGDSYQLGNLTGQAVDGTGGTTITLSLTQPSTSPLVGVFAVYRFDGTRWAVGNPGGVTLNL